MELQGSQALSQQAELISRQLQELRRLEEEVRALRETSLQQKMRLEAQAMELEALARAEKAGRTEAEGLRAALAGAEVVRKNLEEGSQRELEEVQRLHQEQLSSLTQAHQEALSSLSNKAEGLEKSLNSLETRRAGEAKELAVAQREVELLQKQLSKTQEDLEVQVTLAENLKSTCRRTGMACTRQQSCCRCACRASHTSSPCRRRSWPGRFNLQIPWNLSSPGSASHC